MHLTVTLFLINERGFAPHRTNPSLLSSNWLGAVEGSETEGDKEILQVKNEEHTFTVLWFSENQLWPIGNIWQGRFCIDESFYAIR